MWRICTCNKQYASCQYKIHLHLLKIQKFDPSIVDVVTLKMYHKAKFRSDKIRSRMEVQTLNFKVLGKNLVKGEEEMSWGMIRKCPHHLITWEIENLAQFDKLRNPKWWGFLTPKWFLTFHKEAFASTCIHPLSIAFCPKFWNFPFIFYVSDLVTYWQIMEKPSRIFRVVTH